MILIYNNSKFFNSIIHNKQSCSTPLEHWRESLIISKSHIRTFIKLFNWPIRSPSTAQAHLILSHLRKSRPCILIKHLPPRNSTDSFSISNAMIKIDSELYQTQSLKISYLKNKKLLLYFLKSFPNWTPDSFHILISN